MVRIDAVVQQVKRGWDWLIANRPPRAERKLVGFVRGDRVEIQYDIGGHHYRLWYSAECYESARGWAVMFARDDGPFDHEDAETVIELIELIAEWRPALAMPV